MSDARPVGGQAPRAGVGRDPAVGLLVDRAELHDTMMRYAAGVDRRDFALVASCFAADVDATAWGFQGRDALVGFISGVAVFHTTMHMMGNQFVEVDGDRAAMDTYAMLTHHSAHPDGQPWELNPSSNRYVEKLRRTKDGWEITQRGGEPEWSPRGVAGVSSPDPDVRWLLDRAAIHDLMMHYALGIDRREYDRIRSCFAPSFHAAYGAAEFTNMEELLAFIKGVEHFLSTTHFLGTQLIEVAGDAAAMETYSLITHRSEQDGQPSEWAAHGSYRDELVRVAGGWGIAERGERARRVGPEPPVGRSSPDAAVQWLLDRAAIADLVACTALALDRRDWGLYEACFTERPGVDAARAEAEQWVSTQHFLNNQLIDLDGPDAVVETYAYITHRDGPGATQSPWPHGARRFVDRLARGRDGWRIAERHLADNRVAQPAAT